MKLLTVENAKTKHGEILGFLTGILYLSPSDISGVNLCPWSSAGCRKACLYTAGRGRFDSIQEARLIKTIHFLKNRQGFIEQLKDDIRALIRRAEREGLKPAVRLNGTSDVMWHRIDPTIFTDFPGVQFYDYTKNPNIYSENLPANYHITASYNEERGLVESALNIAVVFKNQLPETWHGIKVIDGTKHDLRFLDPKQVVVGLLAKGQAKQDSTGFVVQP